MSNKDKKNDTSIKPNEKLAEKFTEERSIEIFNELINRAIVSNYYSIQETLIENRSLIPYSTFYSLLKRFPILESIKRELEAVIIARVNKGAITNGLSTGASIWRMKQLGETDRSEQTVINKEYEVVL